MPSELGTALHDWRLRVTPGAAGIAAGSGRRTPGLRREEVAALAGVSVDYLVRLEQGRAQNPSAQVLAALARALRLSNDERDHLYRAAGAAPPASGSVSRHPSPGLQRMLDRLVDVPVGLFTAAWELVSANDMWTALFGTTTATPASTASAPTPKGMNLARNQFCGVPSILVRTAEETDRFERELVGDLRQASQHYPDDSELAALVQELRTKSERFDRLWREHSIRPRTADRKTLDSPAIGLITLDCDVLRAVDSDLRLIVYSAVPGSVDADKLALLRVAGVQSIGADSAR